MMTGSAKTYLGVFHSLSQHTEFLDQPRHAASARKVRFQAVGAEDKAGRYDPLSFAPAALYEYALPLAAHDGGFDHDRDGDRAREARERISSSE